VTYKSAEYARDEAEGGATVVAGREMRTRASHGLVTLPSYSRKNYSYREKGRKETNYKYGSFCIAGLWTDSTIQLREWFILNLDSEKLHRFPWFFVILLLRGAYTLRYAHSAMR
jgi:hypothetical protein